MGDIQKRLDNVRQMIQSQDFLEGKGLSNEVNIRIFCYEPRDEMAVRHFIEQLSTDLTLECQLRICNLYQIFLEICEDMDILDAIPDMEEEDGHDYLLEQLQSTIGVDEIVQNSERAVPAGRSTGFDWRWRSVSIYANSYVTGSIIVCREAGACVLPGNI